MHDLTKLIPSGWINSLSAERSSFSLYLLSLSLSLYISFFIQFDYSMKIEAIYNLDKKT